MVKFFKVDLTDEMLRGGVLVVGGYRMPIVRDCDVQVALSLLDACDGMVSTYGSTANDALVRMVRLSRRARNGAHVSIELSRFVRIGDLTWRG